MLKNVIYGSLVSYLKDPLQKVMLLGMRVLVLMNHLEMRSPLGRMIFFVALRNDKFIVLIGANDIDELNNSKIVVTDILPKMIDGKLELIKASTPTPTHSIPAFQIIPAIVTLLAVAYLLRRRK